MKGIKVVLLLPLVAAIGVFVLVAVTVLYLASLVAGTAWRLWDASRARRAAGTVKDRARSTPDGDKPWELLP
ncbi:hypothetical protein CURE108131_04620 [Cupriavidus respiraculi]|uniref:Secreted protein n=1 Tax=Cupriavidus respiraculi TaxID=195930 RepID=A0ABM8WJX5_9BURK|nr:hypothetical protein [Cupriavidus respiraculi]CAG9167618.1 hypothetical protein LMG21510_00796 [Cupriavidus respiraculi]